ncbi:Crp/Fnr family transcriptional regulator [Cohnella herbarum]|uniref:Crp/Fnr family transcriptional regulator n=1 Tax=Cohnella herbarum TaxID=2728023 RepID=A0A7Z2ZQG4_9BACL|nr:Crp/Fnr family transcriptional regulator [Cohnella herbarum]QJD86992.1 Crp/Fnr family transcriptional regulator [Cohnella herbarum]
MSINFPATATNLEESTNPSAGSKGFASFCTPRQFQQLESIMVPMRVASGGFLFWEGDEADNLYYIRSGRVKLRKSTEEGKEIILTILQSGDLICENVSGLSLLQYGFTAEVTDAAEIGVISRYALEALMQHNGELALSFMHWMALSHRVTQSKFRDLLLFGKPGALASTLIRLSNSYGVMEAYGIRIDMKLTHSELADFIGATRESVNRMLNEFKEKGILDFRYGKIIIRQLKALQDICQCPSCPGCSKEICRI